jgi:Tol biopolymer transport system component
MRKFSLALAGLAALFAVAPAAQAAAPGGPRLAYARISFVPSPTFAETPDITDLLRGNLVTSDAVGQQPQVLLGSELGSDVLPTGDISWSPDGSTLALSGQTGPVRETPSSDIYFIGADGSGFRQITGLGDAFAPVLSADGATIYFDRLNPTPPPKITHDGDSTGYAIAIPTTSIWEIRVDGTGLGRLSPKNNSVSYAATSVSPATGDLAFDRSICGPRSCRHSAWLMSPSTGASTLLAKRSALPVFSPDGRQVLLDNFRDHNWRGKRPSSELYALDLSTGAMRRLTHSRNVSEELSSWDPSGQRIAFSSSGPARPRISEINADGTCETPVVSAKKKGAFAPFIVALAWQPGPGREAGRIAC